MLPSHGHIACRKCFTNEHDKTIQLNEWKLQNDPCHWGSNTPRYLILGFSKGFTQTNAFANDRFEDVPFKGMRARLERILKSFGVLGDNTGIDTLFGKADSDVAFASLIRCSASRIDAKKTAQTGREVYSCTGPIIGKSFREIPQIIQCCAESYLLNLPDSLRAVILLGNGDAYLKHTKALIKRLYPDNFRQINDCAIQAGGKLWVWAAHPSGLNGHFENWITSSGKPGMKFEHAISAMNHQLKGQTL